MNGLWRHIMLLLAATFLMSLLSACSDDTHSPSEPSFTDGPEVWLKLDITTAGATVNQNHDTRGATSCNHPTEVGSLSENYISPNGLTIVLLDENRRAFKTIHSGDKEIFSFNGNGTNKTMQLRINSQYADAFMNGASFYVVVVANQTGATGNSDSFSGNFFMKDFDELCGLESSFGISGDPWSPDYTNDKGIPMSGWIKATKPSAGWNQYSSVTGENYNIGTIDMMRGMAKIMVIDKIKPAYPFNTESGDIHPRYRIEKVEFIGINSRGSYLPTGTAKSLWSTGFKAVDCDEASVPSDPIRWYGENAIAKGKLSTTGISIDGVIHDYYSAFIPEIDLENENINTVMAVTIIKNSSAIDDNGIPVIDERTLWHIDLATGKYKKISTENLSDPSKSHDYNTEYSSEIIFDNYTDIVRNHIYQYEIKMKISGILELGITTCPWSKTGTGENEITFD